MQKFFYLKTINGFITVRIEEANDSESKPKSPSFKRQNISVPRSGFLPGSFLYHQSRLDPPHNSAITGLPCSVLGDGEGCKTLQRYSLPQDM